MDLSTQKGCRIVVGDVSWEWQELEEEATVLEELESTGEMRGAQERRA